jgi:hypothetical protein
MAGNLILAEEAEKDLIFDRGRHLSDTRSAQAKGASTA